LVRKIFKILSNQPQGLPIKEVCERLLLLQNEKLNGSGTIDEFDLKAFEDLTFSCIAPNRAGWLLIKKHQWSLSPEGRSAYERYQDPETFIVEAGNLSIKGWLSVHLPRFYFIATKAKDHITAEYKTARRIGFRRVFERALGRIAPWQEALPLQAPRRVVIDNDQLRRSASVAAYLSSLGVPHRTGGHALYLPPSSLARTAFGTLSAGYPPNAGVKIVAGGIDDSTYTNVITKGDSRLQLRLIHHHRHLTLVANLLYSHGLGPRLYDLVELQSGERLWTAYVIEHIRGGIPSLSQCEAGIQKLRQLDSQNIIKVLPPDGFDDEEFECPACCNNALSNEGGEFKYIDFQNFFLGNYQSYLSSIAIAVIEASHEDDLNSSRSIDKMTPAMARPGSIAVNERIAVINQLMESCGVSVKDRVVLDVGCQTGLLMAQYLRFGARWCHGWGQSSVIPHTERLLLALGCTRFSMTAKDRTQLPSLPDDLPSFLEPAIDDCVISYQAARERFSCLQAVMSSPWSFIIYEGKRGETRQDLQERVEQLNALTALKVGAIAEYTAGDLGPRTAAVLINNRAAYT
jgi:hypothetical protein